MRSRYQLCFSVAAFCSVSLVAQAADVPTEYPACETPPTQSERKGAQGAFAAGEASFKEADYATAITYWRDAYRRDCTAHALLRNLATAYELSGDRKAAVHALETYLERQPKDPEAGALQRRIENLREQGEPSEEVATQVIEPSSAAPGGEPEAAPAFSLDAGPDSTTASARNFAPWIVAGAGGAATIAGTIVFFSGKSKVSDATEACPDRKCSPDIAEKGNAGRREQKIGAIVGGVGLAAIAGGLVWGFVFNEPKAEEEVVTGFEPQLGPGFAGFNFATKF